MSWRATHGLDARRAARTLARGAIALKQQLGAELARLLAGWDAHDIAALIGTDRASVSELARGRRELFSRR